MKVIYVLLMVWTTGSSNGGIAVVQQEFDSRESCEAARTAMAKAHRTWVSELKAQGCFRK